MPKYCDIVVRDEGYSGINPLIFGYEQCDPSHCFGPAVRTYWLIHFVVSGKGYYRIGDREYNLTSGEMFVIPPYEETYYEADAQEPWSYIWIGFRCDSELPTPLADTLVCPEAPRIFNSMKSCKNMENGQSAYLNAKLWELFSMIMEKNDRHYDYIDMALDHIHSEYMNDISIAGIASAINLDRRYFSKVFKDKIGMSPKEYLLRYRMSIASSLMINKGKSVSLAAYSVGYTDLFNFSKMFKRYYGMSPREYVNQKKE